MFMRYRPDDLYNNDLWEMVVEYKNDFCQTDKSELIEKIFFHYKIFPYVDKLVKKNRAELDRLGEFEDMYQKLFFLFYKILNDFEIKTKINEKKSVGMFINYVKLCCFGRLRNLMYKDIARSFKQDGTDASDLPDIIVDEPDVKIKDNNNEAVISKIFKSGFPREWVQEYKDKIYTKTGKRGRPKGSINVDKFIVDANCILKYHYVHNYSKKRIGRVIGMTDPNVSNILNTAKKILKWKLEKMNIII